MADTQLIPIKDFLGAAEVQRKFQTMLGNKAAGFMVSVINTVTNDKMLAEADRNSILFAAATAATLDLPINQNLGFAYILPYRTKTKSVVEKDGKQVTIWEERVLAQFQLGYKGFVQLAMRSGQFKTISATPIYEGQLAEENPLTGFKFDFVNKLSDTVIGYAGYFQLTNGFEKTLYMTIDELQKHGKKYSQSFKKGYGLWNDNFDAMAQKTVLKLLLSKFAPLSIEMQKAVQVDQAVIQDWEGESLEHTDNDNKVSQNAEEVAKQKEEERTLTYISSCKSISELMQAEEYVLSLPGEHPLRQTYDEKFSQLEALEEEQK